SWWRKRQSVPAALRNPMAALSRMGAGVVPTGQRREQLSKLAEVLAAGHAGTFYRQFVSYWKDPSQVLIGADIPSTRFDDASHGDFFERMMLLDATTYLPDDILVKVDRAAMVASLETRVPVIGQRVFELSQRLPLHYKIRNGKGKWLRKEVLYRHVPREMV